MGGNIQKTTAVTTFVVMLNATFSICLSTWHLQRLWFVFTSSAPFFCFFIHIDATHTHTHSICCFKIEMGVCRWFCCKTIRANFVSMHDIRLWFHCHVTACVYMNTYALLQNDIITFYMSNVCIKLHTIPVIVSLWNNASGRRRGRWDKNATHHQIIVKQWFDTFRKFTLWHTHTHSDK